jgi:hypothetical protein
VKFGAFLGFLAVLAVAVGGCLAMRDEEWEDAPMPVDVRPTPPAEGPPTRAAAEAEPRVGA